MGLRFLRRCFRVPARVIMGKTRTKGDSHLKPRQEGRLETIALFRSGALRTGALAAVAAKGLDKGLLQPAVTKYVFSYYCKGKTATPNDVDEEEGKSDAHVPLALQILCRPSLRKACRIFAHYY